MCLIAFFDSTNERVPISSVRQPALAKKIPHDATGFIGRQFVFGDADHSLSVANLRYERARGPQDRGRSKQNLQSEANRSFLQQLF